MSIAISNTFQDDELITPVVGALRTNNFSSPRVLSQSAIPFILAGGTATNQFTVSATGLVTALPTLPITSGFAFVYMPSGVTGTAGWYYAQILSATSVQLYTARYTSGEPRLAVPTTLVNQSATAGSYSQTTGSDITSIQFTIPGGSLGPTGGLDVGAFVRISDSTNLKQIATFLAGSNLWSNNTNAAGNVSSQSLTRTRNRNSQTSQVNSGGFLGGVTNFWSGASSAPLYTTVNTAVDTVLSVRHQIAVSSDFVMLEMFDVQLRYGA